MVEMYEGGKQAWLNFINAYKKLDLLWDTKHENYSNKYLRNEAHDELLELYKKIDADAEMDDMKKRIFNMRTTYNRERKRVIQSIRTGDDHKPKLWYYDLFSFLNFDSDIDGKYDTIKHFRKTPITHRQMKRGSDSSNTPTNRTSDRLNGTVNIKQEIISSPVIEEQSNNTQPPPPKRRIFDLLEKQEAFIHTASHMLTRKEAEWEVQGKSIGLQLYKLDDTQRHIAQKLISDAIFFGTLGKLTVDSFIHVNNRQESPEIQEIDYLDEEAIISDDDE